ncbi:signal peptidase II, partial [Candidatus Cryosericum odellii]
GPVGLVLTMNKGVAFGLFGGRQWVVPVNAVLGLGVCVAAIVALHRGDRGLAHGFLLVFAGFAGNFIDRVVAGQVTDFLWVRGWSVFNVADCLVTTGAILCGLALLFPHQWGFHA